MKRKLYNDEELTPQENEFYKKQIDEYVTLMRFVTRLPNVVIDAHGSSTTWQQQYFDKIMEPFFVVLKQDTRR